MTLEMDQSLNRLLLMLCCPGRLPRRPQSQVAKARGKAKAKANPKAKASSKAKAKAQPKPKTASKRKASTKEDFVYDPGFPGAEWKGRSYESWASKHYHAARELARNQGLSDDDDAKGCAREARAKSAETWKATFKQ